ncbi:MAG: VCBS repeat-containing protein [Kofleriaceae bacterium]
MLRLAYVLVLVTACTDFSDVARGVCGNGLLEPGEDCDSESASCVRCAVSCNAASDCPTDAYTCGVDGFCHAPSGVLGEPTAPVAFQADDLRIADIDRDGTGDVLGVSNTSIVVRHGDAAGSLLTADSFVTPAQSGPSAFGDLDGDGVDDVSLVTPDGIVAYTSEFGTLSPVAIESPLFDEEGGALNLRTLFAIAPELQLGAFIEDNGAMVLAVIDPIPPENLYAVLPCVARLGPLASARLPLAQLDIYRVSALDAVNVAFVISFITDTGELCATSIHGSQATGYTFADITPVAANTMTTRPVFADLDADGDPCPSLINSDGGSQALRAWHGKTVGGRCTLEPGGVDGVLLPAVPNSPADAVAIGRAPISPGIPGLGADGFVLTSGMYALAPGFNAIAELYSSSPRELAHVASGDLDRDGDIDVVLATAADDLDILYRLPLNLQLFRLDTASDVTSLTIGDFDGNGLPDIAYTETQTDHQNMLISYGTTDRPLAPVQVASFSGVSTVSRIQFPDSVDTANVADDLAVIHVSASALPTMSLLHGSPQRTMLSFFDPRTDAMQTDALGRPVTILRGSVIGDFTDAQPGHRDLLAVATPGPGQTVGMRAWRVPGTDLGLDSAPNDGLVANGLSACDGTGVCVGTAEYLAWPVAPGRDVVIAVDREQPMHAAVLDPWANDVALAKTEIPLLGQGVPTGAVIRSLYAGDIDGDGTLDLVAAFAKPDSSEGSVRVCRMSATGVPQACDELLPVIAEVEPTVTACIDAAPGRVAARGDLVVLCNDGAGATSLYRVSHGSGAYVATLLAHSVGLNAVRVGDVTGDGVDDVIAVQGTGGSRSLIVFPQCGSRDASSCQQIRAQGSEAP